jgi:arylsulfatase A-like enzyme
MMTRRRLVNGLVAATAVGAGVNLLHGCGDRRTSHNQNRGRIGRNNYPNILILLIDDLRPQLNCYGRREMVSPNIDRLAAEGTLFERAYCQVPICGASRASTLAGTRATPTRFGSDYQARKDEDMPNEPSLPLWFKNKGYRTISYGKIYHVIQDDADSWLEEPWRPRGMWGLESYVTPENRAIVEAHGGTYGPPFEMANVADNIYTDGQIADRTVRTLERLQDGHAPFFLATGLFRPHLPFNSPTPYWDLYQRENLSLADNPFRPAGAPDAALHNWGELRHYYGIPAEGPLSDEMALNLIHGYYAATSYADALVGQILNALDRLELADNTIVILWGDHGWQLGEHGLWCKHANFETSLHAPMIIRGPGIPAGQRTDALVEFVDIYPSLCDLSGLEKPEHLEGSSFVPLLENPNLPWKEAVFSYYNGGHSVKSDRYRYTEWTNDDGFVWARMLYDHVEDPGETVNLAERSEAEAIVAQHQQMLEQGWSVYQIH